MNTEIFVFDDYKSFLKEWLDQLPEGGHGMKAKLAAVSGCQTSYVSQVLNGTAHFSPEQAEKIARHVGLSDEGTRFFLLLIQRARAGTDSLRKLVTAEILAIRKRMEKIANRVKTPVGIAAEAQGQYFSRWIYSAVHLLAISDRAPNAVQISSALRLPEGEIRAAIEFLVEIGLLRIEKGRFRSGRTKIHLPQDSPFIRQHHANWRLRALHDIERGDEESLHYSSVVTISPKDAERIRALLLKELDAIRKIVDDSPSDDLHCLNFDFFRFRN